MTDPRLGLSKYCVGLWNSLHNTVACLMRLKSFRPIIGIWVNAKKCMTYDPWRGSYRSVGAARNRNYHSKQPSLFSLSHQSREENGVIDPLVSVFVCTTDDKRRVLTCC